MSRSSKRNRKNPFKSLSRQLHLETLEDRSMPSCTSISGFVYFDANGNGLYDVGTEAPIANSSIELHDANGDVVGTTTTDANGFYTFDMDMAHATKPAELTKTVTFDPTQTNFSLQGMLDQFDPSLGDLQSIDIQHSGSITSEIKVENVSQSSQSDISGTVSGTLTLSAPNVNDPLSISDAAGSFHAGTYDGATDFAGSSGGSFGQQTANGSDTVTLTGSDMDPYVGTGQVAVTEDGVATSNATGGGNLDVQVRSTGQSTITVTYHYLAHDCLPPGDYTIVQTQEPEGYIDGKDSTNGVVDQNSIGTDEIHVTLGDTDLANNNFGEMKSTQISGHVWFDANNDGVRDPSETLIPGVTISLDGANGTQTTTTDANGFYSFTDLMPGTYTIRETQPDGYLDGKDSAGTLGGNAVNDPSEDQIQNITLQSGDSSENNDFGELQASSLEGHVYFDANNNGAFDAGETPIANTTVTLTGFDDNGPVNLSVQTDATGEFKFDNLRPGTYAINETQPAGYLDGKDTVGTQGGDVGNDTFTNIQLPAGTDGVNNDFGETKASKPPVPTTKDQGLVGFLPIISKTQRTNLHNISNIDPVLRGQMAFIVASQVTLQNHQPDLAQTWAGVQALQAGTTQQAYIQSLWTSNAHRQIQAAAIYRDVLDRAPTAAEAAQTISDLKGGATELSIKETLFNSAEFQAAHSTPESLAQALYKDIVNVTPGDDQTQSLVQAMDAQPLSDVIHGLLTSDAALSNQIDNTYRATLRRPASQSEIQTWVPQIQAGTLSLDRLAQRLLGTQEFYMLAFNRIK
jgi:protocatechuate 3,4-dioxygenase beta subunit